MTLTSKRRSVRAFAEVAGEVVGVDLSEAMLRVARGKNRRDRSATLRLGRYPVVPPRAVAALAMPGKVTIVRRHAAMRAVSAPTRAATHRAQGSFVARQLTLPGCARRSR